MTDDQIENEIQAKGLTAPRVTPSDIEANIASEHYFTAWDATRTFNSKDTVTIGSDLYNDEHPSVLKTLTFCILVLRNGFTVTGKSACASPENFDAELGRKIARQDAVNQMWALMGYELKQRLYKG